MQFIYYKDNKRKEKENRNNFQKYITSNIYQYITIWIELQKEKRIERLQQPFI